MALDSLSQDIRYAIRTLRRAPLFAATVVATMGLGLGLLASAFTILNAYLLKPIDLPEPHALYSLSWDTETTRRQRFTLADYQALQPEARRFATVAAAHDVTFMQDAVSVGGLLVTGNYFELLGARASLGRLLRPDDAVARGGRAVVVLSNNAWRSRYGSDPGILGRQIQLGRQRFEVVGVTEPHSNLARQEFVSFWAPLTMAGAFAGTDPWAQPDEPSLAIVGRLRQDATATSVRAWLDVWLRQRYLRTSAAAPVAVRVESLATRVVLDGATLTMFVFIMSAFGLVLLVASANVTNLMLARALTRQPEIAVRLALGASRWRVARQLIVESLVLALPAAAAGLALSMVTARLFPAVILATWPASVVPLDNILVPLDSDWRVMAFLAAASILSAVLITLAPAARLAGLRLSQASRGQASSDARGSRLRSGLVAMQIGACVLFLVAAVGLLDETSRLANPQLNLSYERVATINIDPTVRDAVATRLASDARVEQVAASWKPPLMGSLPTTLVTASGTRIAQSAGYTAVSPEYFTMFDIQIVRGRAFTPAEAAAGSAVAIVSEATAVALWPGLDPLGQTLDLAAIPEGRSGRRLHDRVRVIGVTEDVATGTILDGIDPTCVYFPTDMRAPTDVSLLVRSRTADVEGLRPAVAAAVKAVAPEATFQVFSMRTAVGAGAWIFRAFSVTASILGIVGLLFAYSGTHAVVSFLVAQRTREFGVRMALGATAWQSVRGMLVQTSRTAFIGLAAGLAVAGGLVRLFSASAAMMPDFGARPFVVGAAIVLVATAVAAMWPLRNAARIDPAQALRTE
ncbi:MAG TPA: ABC transporter permease [Vicinamibacterales bacterium]|nr:ABC transporter permease [Vicinamibacterales bacterium]